MAIPKLAVIGALTLANMALGMTRKIEGPRLDDLKFTGGDYGAPLPFVWGTRRMACPIFHGEPLREVKRRRKTKGGKFNEYSYYGTFAFALADHEIDAVRRVWFDKHLVLDLSGEGPVTPFDFAGEGTGGKSASGVGAWLESEWFSIYLGTETQGVDPRIESYIESLHGEGSATAYRGVAYVVIKDLPLEKFGNRIPQIEAEVLSASAGNWPTELKTLTYQPARFKFSHDYTFIGTGQATGAALLDTAARTVISEFAFSPALTDQDFGVENAGTILGLTTSGGGYVYRYQIGGGGSAYVDVNSSTYLWTVQDANGIEHWATKNLFDGDDFYFDGVATNLLDATGVDWNISMMFADADGAVWAVGGENPGATKCYFYRLHGVGAGPDFIQVTGLATDTHSNGAVHYKDATRDQFVFEWDGDLLIYDRLTAAVTGTLSGYSPATETFEALRPGAGTIWKGLNEISLADLSIVRTLTIGLWGLGVAPTQTIYDPINHALIVPDGYTLRWLYLDRVSPQTVLLSSIMGDMADRCGVADYDYSALDQTISGYSATQGQASSMVEPLLDAYDSDQRPHDFQIQGIKRTGSGSGEITTERMVANEPRYKGRVLQGAELPRSVTINFADIDADQQPNNARADRPLDATDAKGEQVIDLTTLVLSADSAGQLARRWFRRKWNDRFEVNFATTMENMALEPGDVKTLELDGKEIAGRCLRAVFSASGEIEQEWRYDHPQLALLDSAVGASFDGRIPDVISVALLSKGFFLDIPLITDADDQTTPALYVAAAPYAAGAWPGAVAYQATGGEYSDEIASVPSGSQATWGYSTDVLADANPNIWDRLNTVNVSLQVGTLAGTTEAAIDADTTLNLAYIGGEIVQFATATLEGDGTYTLSGFKRGRRGTEWACATHAAGEDFLLLDTAQDVAMGLSEVATNLSFKAITSGRTTGFPVDLTPFTGASLKPYAPCQLTATLTGSDWVFTWVRRTRVGGAWTGGAAIPLSEASEEYELYLGDGVTDVTKTVAGATTYTWTAAQQTTDTGSGVTSGELTFSMAQVSDAVGAGFVAVY